MTVGERDRDAGGGELDPERQVVQQVADLGDDLGVVAGHPARPGRHGRAR